MLISPDPQSKANFDSNFSGVIASKRLEQPELPVIKEMSVDAIKRLVEELQLQTAGEESAFKKMISFVQEFGSFAASIETVLNGFSAG